MQIFPRLFAPWTPTWWYASRCVVVYFHPCCRTCLGSARSAAHLPAGAGVCGSHPTRWPHWSGQRWALCPGSTSISPRKNLRRRFDPRSPIPVTPCTSIARTLRRFRAARRIRSITTASSARSSSTWRDASSRCRLHRRFPRSPALPSRRRLAPLRHTFRASRHFRPLAVPRSTSPELVRIVGSIRRTLPRVAAAFSLHRAACYDFL